MWRPQKPRQRASADRREPRRRDALADELSNAPRDTLRMQVVLRAKHVLRAVVHVLVRHTDAVKEHVGDTELLHALHDRRAESAGKRALFDGDDPRARMAVSRD